MTKWLQAGGLVLIFGPRLHFIGFQQKEQKEGKGTNENGGVYRVSLRVNLAEFGTEQW
jgi:hypothetical protein